MGNICSRTNDKFENNYTNIAHNINSIDRFKNNGFENKYFRYPKNQKDINKTKIYFWKQSMEN